MQFAVLCVPEAAGDSDVRPLRPSEQGGAEQRPSHKLFLNGEGAS